MPYRLIKKEGAARRGEFQTVHGTVQTPAFQNVATAAAIKGGLSAHDLKEIRAQVMLCNTDVYKRQTLYSALVISPGVENIG